MTKKEFLSGEELKLLRALSDEARLGIIKILLEKECECVCNLSSKIKKDQSVVFRHIMILKEAGIVKTEKKNKFLFCRIKDKNSLLKFFKLVKNFKK
ncbi:MAG: ArsR/SmtB family transcription factor [Candidatus Woesearchaeota archaeon]